MRWVLSFFAACSLSAAPYDLVLQNGRLIDGTGKPARAGDLAIREGRIVAVGNVEGTAKRTIDVGGRIITPGFVDVHTHAENVEKHPAAKAFLRMGVTTLVLGNCGSSRIDLGEYFSELDQKGFSPNVTSLIGHGTVRRQVMGGSFMRPPNTDELAAMRRLVRDAMRDGAVGMSTGLIYLPGTFSKTEELIALSKEVAKSNGIYVSHMRSEGKEIFKAVDEVCRIAREAGLPAHISHLKLAGKPMWGKNKKLIARLDRARTGGVRLTHDQYAYTASSTGIQQMIPSEARRAGRKKFAELLSDPDKKKKLVDEMKGSLEKKERDSYAYAVIAYHAHDKSLNGLNIVEAAKKRYGKSNLDDQIELILDIEKNGGASGVFHGMNEDDVRAFIRSPFTMFASDSSVRVYKSGVPHPRGYGNAARFLARYVREQKVITLEEAVRRLTALPARTFKLKDRGELKPGYWADVVVFDPAKIKDQATFKNPHQYAVGFRLVLVNGAIVVENDKHNGAGPGQIIRGPGFMREKKN